MGHAPVFLYKNTGFRHVGRRAAAKNELLRSETTRKPGKEEGAAEGKDFERKDTGRQQLCTGISIEKSSRGKPTCLRGEV